MTTISFYFDEMLPRKAAEQLTAKGYKVVRAVDVEMTGKDDLNDHLPFAAQHGLVLVTFDRPFAGRASSQQDHAGLICLSCSPDDIGGIVRSLTRFADEYSAEDAAGHVYWL